MKSDREALLMQRQKEFRNIKTLNVIIDEEYDKRTIFGYPYKKIIEILFDKLAGWQVSYNSESPADVSLKIVSQYYPESEYYSGNLTTATGIQYTAALLYGSITMIVPKTVTITERFREYKKPPKYNIKNCPPNSAPFWEVFHAEQSVLYKLIKIYRDIMGNNCLFGLAVCSEFQKLENEYSYPPPSFCRAVNRSIVYELLNSPDSLDYDRLIEMIEISQKYDRYKRLFYDEFEKGLKPSLDKSDYSSIKIICTRVIGKTYDPRATDFLIDIINTYRHYRGLYVIVDYALDSFIDMHKENSLDYKTVVPFLIEILDNELQKTYMNYASEIVETLQELTGQKIYRDVDKWETWWHSQIN